MDSFLTKSICKHNSSACQIQNHDAPFQSYQRQATLHSVPYHFVRKQKFAFRIFLGTSFTYSMNNPFLSAMLGKCWSNTDQLAATLPERGQCLAGVLYVKKTMNALGLTVTWVLATLWEVSLWKADNKKKIAHDGCL